MFKFYFDDIEVENPINWMDFTETIEYSDIIKGILPKYDIKLNFFGGAYQYLFNIKKNDGFCNLVKFRIEESCSNNKFDTILNGYISIARCKFNLNRCVVECDILDNNYGAMIFNNKSIKTSLGGTKTKSGLDINTVEVSKLRLFNPVTGYWDDPGMGYERDCWTIFNAFKYLISWMTDNTVQFESDFFFKTGLQAKGRAVILTGKKLRTNGDGLFPVISFEELFQEVYKRYNIAFTIVERNGIPTLKIEDVQSFKSTVESLSLNKIDNLLESYNPELLFSGIKMGGTIAPFDNAIHSFIPKQFIGFDTEEYYFQTICNIDKIQDLQYEWLGDTNIIEELGYTNTTNVSYDKNNFIIESVYDLGIDYASQYPTRLGRWMYNGHFLTNEKISEKFNVYGDVILYNGIDLNSFQAERTNYLEYPGGANFPHTPGFADVVHNDLDPNLKITEVFQKYDQDSSYPNFNTGLNYDPTNGRFTAPLDGSYFFEMDTFIRIFSEQEVLSTLGVPRATRFGIRLNHYDSGGLMIQSYSTFYPDSLVPDISGFIIREKGIYEFTNTGYINMLATDYVTTSVEVQSIAQSYGDWLWCNITNGSTFKTTATPTGGGVFKKGNMDDYFVSRLEFVKPLSNEDYKTLKEDLRNSISVSTDENSSTKKGWIRKVVRKLATGETNWELITNKQNLI